MKKYIPFLPIVMFECACLGVRTAVRQFHVA